MDLVQALAKQDCNRRAGILRIFQMASGAGLRPRPRLPKNAATLAPGEKLQMKTLSTALIIALCGSLAQAAELTKDTLAAVRQNVASGKAVLVDVREKHEWDAGRVKGSIFAPLSGLKNPDAAQQLQTTLPKDKVLYTFCVVGKRAVAAGNLLEKLGYEVRPLRPGYNELLKAGFEKAAD